MDSNYVTMSLEFLGLLGGVALLLWTIPEIILLYRQIKNDLSNKIDKYFDNKE